MCFQQLTVECGIETDVLPQPTCLSTAFQQGGIVEMMRFPPPVLTSLFGGANEGDVPYLGAVRCGPAVLWS